MPKHILPPRGSPKDQGYLFPTHRIVMKIKLDNKWELFSIVPGIQKGLNPQEARL